MSLRDAAVSIETLQIPVFEFIHFLAVAYDFRLANATRHTRSLLPLYIAYWLTCVGGGLWVGVLLGQPAAWLCAYIYFSPAGPTPVHAAAPAPVRKPARSLAYKGVAAARGGASQDPAHINISWAR